MVTATDPDLNHVNGTHIDFVQKGENPSSREPMFVVYTDQGKKEGQMISIDLELVEWQALKSRQTFFINSSVQTGTCG